MIYNSRVPHNTIDAESLERRVLLASIASLGVDGIINVRGTAAADSIIISHSGTSIVVRVNSETKHFDAASVKAVSVLGQGGDDRIEMRAGLPSTLSGGDGDDTLIGGPGPDHFRLEPAKTTTFIRIRPMMSSITATGLRLRFKPA